MSIKTKLVGVTYGDAQENIKLFGCKDVGSFAMAREPDNPHAHMLSVLNSAKNISDTFCCHYIPIKLLVSTCP